MGAVAVGQFRCDACGKNYRWKPELAGRKARCKCGAVMFCPPAEPGKEEDDLFELAPDPVVTKPASTVVLAMPAGAVPVATIAAAPSKPLSYHNGPGEPDKSFPNKVIDLYAPLCVFGASVGIESIAILLAVNKTGLPASAFAGDVVIQMAFILICLSLGVFLCAKTYQIKLGPLPSALLKLLAISVAPGTAMDLMSVPLHFLPLLGTVLNWLFGFILYFALLGVFFDMDQEDTWRCVMTIFFMRIMVLLGMNVVPMLMHH